MFCLSKSRRGLVEINKSSHRNHNYADILRQFLRGDERSRKVARLQRKRTYLWPWWDALLVVYHQGGQWCLADIFFWYRLPLRPITSHMSTTAPGTKISFYVYSENEVSCVARAQRRFSFDISDVVMVACGPTHGVSDYVLREENTISEIKMFLVKVLH